MKRQIVLVRGGGDLASAIIQKLHNARYRVIVSEIERPRMVRRTVSYGNAVYEGEYSVEGITAVRASLDEVVELWQQDKIPVVVEQEAAILEAFSPAVFIDATLSKKTPDYTKDIAPLSIGLGPEIIAGEQADVVIETTRGHDLSRLIFHGKAAENTHVPGSSLGYTTERVLRSPAHGKLETTLEIGELVSAGQVLGHVAGEPVVAQINGVLRGWIHPTVELTRGMKIGDIDPRMKPVYCQTISDKGRGLAGGVLEAILMKLDESTG